MTDFLCSPFLYMRYFYRSHCLCYCLFIECLRRLDWPADRYRILVVADNCTDATAEIARAAGATVLERMDPQRRGKGYALQFAFSASAAQGRAEAVAVVDADAEVSSNLLAAFAAQGAVGAQAVQAHYGILNPMDSWRTRLITIAKGTFHILRSRARERLRVSAGVPGNGWCVTHVLLQQVPYAALSLTEDLEYGIALGLAGIRVHYADEAHADGEMVSGSAVAATQRRRWERGRFALIRSRSVPLLMAAFRRRSALCLDLALDLLVLPLSYVTLNVALLLVAAGVATWRQIGSAGWLWLAAGCGLSLVLYVLRGWRLSGIGARGILDLARAPFFLVWKLLLILRPHGSAEWIRTHREALRAERKGGVFVRMFGSAILTKAMLSAASLLVGLILIRETTVVQYGDYILIINGVALLTGLQNGFIQPAMVTRLARLDARGRRGLIGGLYRGQRRLLPVAAAIAAMIIAVLCITGSLAWQTGLLVLAATAAALAALFREFFRMVLLGYRRPMDVFRADSVYVSLLVAHVSTLVRGRHRRCRDAQPCRHRGGHVAVTGPVAP